LLDKTKDRIADYLRRMRDLRNSFDVPDVHSGISTDGLALGGAMGSDDRSRLTGPLGEGTTTEGARELVLALGSLRNLAGEDSAMGFLGALSAFEFKDKAGIINVLLDAPQDYRDIVLAFSSYIHIPRVDSAGFLFNPERRIIHYNVALDRNNPRGPYYWFFHEVAHLIDWMVGPLDYLTKSPPFRDATFAALQIDVENMLRQVANSLHVDTTGLPPINPDFVPWPLHVSRNSGKDRDTLIRELAIANIMAGNLVVATEEDEEELDTISAFQLYLQRTMSGVLNGDSDPNRTPHNMSNPSNVFGGITNNVVHGATYHPEANFPGYWFNNQGRPTFNQNSEFFAHRFAAGILNNHDAIANDSYFFPEAMRHYDELFDHILNDVQAREDQWLW